MYGPYEPPPPTEPPPAEYAAPLPGPMPGLQTGWLPGPVAVEGPDGLPALGRAPAASAAASAAWPLLAVLGLGMALLGIFALPTQSYAQGIGRDVGFVQIHDVVTNAGFPGAAGPLARFWWSGGVLLAGAVLTVLTGALCVAGDRRVLRSLGVGTAGAAVLTGVVHGLALGQTHDFASIISLGPPSLSLYHDAGPGTWLGFAGLVALAVGAAATARAGRPAPP